MDITKYRKWYLKENWADNRFIMIKYKTHIRQMIPQYRMRGLDEFWEQWNHPFVKSGKAYWINDHELCVGYELRENPEIFRPIFSHKRQKLLDKVNKNIIKPIKFWNKVKSRYFFEICKIKNLPIECIKRIVMFTSYGPLGESNPNHPCPPKG